MVLFRVLSIIIVFNIIIIIIFLLSLFWFLLFLFQEMEIGKKKEDWWLSATIVWPASFIPK